MGLLRLLAQSPTQAWDAWQKRRAGPPHAAAAVDAARKNFIASEDIPSDKNILAAVAKAFYSDIDQSQHPLGSFDKIGTYGGLSDEATYKKWAKIGRAHV